MKACSSAIILFSLSVMFHGTHSSPFPPMSNAQSRSDTLEVQSYFQQFEPVKNQEQSYLQQLEPEKNQEQSYLQQSESDMNAIFEDTTSPDQEKEKGQHIVNEKPDAANPTTQEETAIQFNSNVFITTSCFNHVAYANSLLPIARQLGAEISISCYAYRNVIRVVHPRGVAEMGLYFPNGNYAHGCIQYSYPGPCYTGWSKFIPAGLSHYWRVQLLFGGPRNGGGGGACLKPVGFWNHC